MERVKCIIMIWVEAGVRPPVARTAEQTQAFGGELSSPNRFRVIYLYTGNHPQHPIVYAKLRISRWQIPTVGSTPPSLDPLSELIFWVTRAIPANVHLPRDRVGKRQ